ncbi:MAG: c-type cytochrome [Planctomycetes bacterium]|nr:c-type cytochrome [Planctomycetota bacterium]
MFKRAIYCTAALALCLSASAMAILADGDKPAEPKAAATRKDVPEDFKKLEAPDLSAKATIDAGGETYAKSCAKCHGDAGKGDGENAGKMTPKPSDLTSAEFHDAVSDQYIYWRIKTGAEGYAGEGKSKMKAMSSASDEQLWQLVAYTRSLRPAKVEILDKDQYEEVMDGFKAAWKNLRAQAEARDQEKTQAEADKIVALAAKLPGFDGDVRDGENKGKKVRDQADYKKFVENFQKAVAEYAAQLKAGDWEKADAAQGKIGEGCESCHEVYKKKRRK